jgi:hypothetical protein
MIETLRQPSGRIHRRVNGHRKEIELTSAAQPDTFASKLILFLTITITPLLDSLPGIGPLSLAWIWFAALSGYVLSCHGGSFWRVARQPTFIAAGFFVGVSALIEATRTGASFTYLLRFSQTVAAAMMIASLCRSRATLELALRAIVLFALGISTVLLFQNYGEIAGTQVEGFSEASILREELFQAEGFFRDLNRVGFLCGLGAVGAFVFCITASRLVPRLFWLVTAALCTLGASITFSRSAIVVATLALFTVLAISRRKLLVPVIASSLVLGVCLYLFLPRAVLERYRLFDEGGKDKPEARQNVYTQVVKTMPLYWSVGVGSGNYTEWAREHGITVKQGDPVGAHNSYFQVWIFWGLISLLAFLALLFSAYQCLPKRAAMDPVALALVGISSAMFLRLAFTHNFYVKDFAIVLGLLTAAGLWIWPGRVAECPNVPGEKSLRPSPGKLRFRSDHGSRVLLRNVRNV